MPFLIKDDGPTAEGVPFTVGSRHFQGAVAPWDDGMMKRFRSAGLVTLGSTAVPEMAISLATESVLNGATRNPWDTSRSASGPSSTERPRGVAGGHRSSPAGSERGRTDD